jgi:hypothetical protein
MKINKLLESKNIDESFDNGLSSFLETKVVEVDGVIGLDPKEVKASNMPRGCRILSGSLLGGRVYDHGTILWKGREYVFRVKNDSSVKVMTTAQAGSNWSETIFKEAFEKDGGPFWYFTKHGLGPGMLPKGVNVVDTIEDDNFGTYIALDKVLSTQELKEYELVEKKPSMDEAFKPTDSGIQSVKCYNRYNYTIQELRVDNDNKTFERGNFTAGKADKKVKNRQEYEDIVDTLKELGYTEIKSDYRSLRNKTRKGIPTNESKSIGEGTIPRNATKIRATDRMNKKSIDLYKHDKYWKDSEGEDYNLYDPAYLRKWNDIEVLETDPNYKPNRTKPEYVVQGNYGYGWEDLTASDNPLEAKADLKAYRENELGVAHRLITRRVPVNESKSLKESRPDKEQSNTSNKKVTIKYGNSVKEVETCKPIKVTNKQLQDYKDNYSQVTIVESKSIKTFGAKGRKLNEFVQDTVTRYQVEYFIDENDDSDTPLETYVYTDSKQEAIAKVKEEYPNAQIVYCVPEDVPAKYKEWDMKEGYEFNPNNADISWRPYDNEKGQVMADRWYAKHYPDDKVGIEQLDGITLDDALKDRSILGHCDTQVRDRVYAQLDKYIPLSKDSPMFKEVNEARRKASDPKQIEKAEKSMFNSLMNGAYNTEWMIQDAKMIYGITYQEATDAFRKAYNRYMIESGELDESKESDESELITQYINNGEFDKLEKVHNGTNVVWKLKEPVNETFDDDVDDLSYYYNEEDIIDALNDVWEEISSKQVADSDGFMTDYTMYRNINTGEYVFVFGDKDIYKPEDGYFDWECETEEEAKEWFDNYHGFDDSDDDVDWMNEDVEKSPIIHKKSDGSYLVTAENGDGYVAYNKDDVCMGNISANNENEAKSKFNSNQFDE